MEETRRAEVWEENNTKPFCNNGTQQESTLIRLPSTSDPAKRELPIANKRPQCVDVQSLTVSQWFLMMHEEPL